MNGIFTFTPDAAPHSIVVRAGASLAAQPPAFAICGFCDDPVEGIHGQPASLLTADLSLLKRPRTEMRDPWLQTQGVPPVLRPGRSEAPSWNRSAKPAGLVLIRNSHLKAPVGTRVGHVSLNLGGLVWFVWVENPPPVRRQNPKPYIRHLHPLANCGMRWPSRARRTAVQPTQQFR